MADQHVIDRPDAAAELELVPVTARVGAEVRGVRLSGDADEATIAAIRAALVRHKVLFFRGQSHIDDAVHEAFAERMGEPLKHPIRDAAGGSKFLFELDAGAGYGASFWHTDLTFTLRPAEASILRPVVLPPVGGDTMWANTAAAYEHLPEPMRIQADALRAIHSSNFNFDVLFGEVLEMADTKKNWDGPAQFETEHPVVRVHPESGERALMLGSFFKRFVGLNGADSQRLYGMLQDHITRPENVVRWRWQAGDVVIWDNRATQHRVVADFGSADRVMRRATIMGSVPVGIDGVESREIRNEVL